MKLLLGPRKPWDSGWHIIVRGETRFYPITQTQFWPTPSISDPDSVKLSGQCFTPSISDPDSVNLQKQTISCDLPGLISLKHLILSNIPLLFFRCDLKGKNLHEMLLLPHFSLLTQHGQSPFLILWQEYIFRLEPGNEDSGKGKCPYDPKLNSVSALISEYHQGFITSSNLSALSPFLCPCPSGFLLTRG